LYAATRTGYAGATVEGSQRLILVRGMDLGIKAATRIILASCKELFS
jgi:hypothetical protein